MVPGGGLRWRLAPELDRDRDRPAGGYDSVMTDLTVQIFGHERDQGTRAAIRFFKERRVAIHLVDLTRKPIARGEIRRFVERFGAPALIDQASRAYRDGGLGYLRMDDGEALERLLRDQTLLRLPLVRFGNDVAVGRDEATWKRWFKAGGA
jgi:arsenate reductase-like glutaredoxin family protein